MNFRTMGKAEPRKDTARKASWDRRRQREDQERIEFKQRPVSSYSSRWHLPLSPQNPWGILYTATRQEGAELQLQRLHLQAPSFREQRVRAAAEGAGPSPVTSQVRVTLCFSFTVTSSRGLSPTMCGGTEKENKTTQKHGDC